MKLVKVVTSLAGISLVLAACSENDDETGDDQSTGDIASEASGTVAFLLPENVTPRWESADRDAFEASMSEYAPDAEVEFFNALNDASQQQQQAEQAITQGAEALVIAAVDRTAASVIVEDAAAAGVPVIAYDRLIEDAPLDYFITFDGEQVGRAQGEWLIENTEDGDQLVVIHGSEDDDNAQWFADGYMPVLNQAVDNGTRTIGYESWTPGWDPSTAQEQMEAALTQLDNDVQGVLSANDGMAATILAALEAQGMTGEVPVTGQDATQQGLQLILEGTQGMSVFKDFAQQADVAAQISASLLADQEVSADLVPDTRDNGQLDVPSRLLDVQVIDEPQEVMLAVDAGIHELSEICQGVSADVEICTDA